ncbi:hypothetical protein ASE41_20465 [Streptomyces sp. Root264]|nr:hypothetical protein ASE41_20465 [Streptomyces sp. Root264]
MYLLDFQEIDRTAKLNAATLFDLVKLSFGVVAGAGALVALVVAYRRQRVDEAGAHREATSDEHSFPDQPPGASGLVPLGPEKSFTASSSACGGPTA